MELLLGNCLDRLKDFEDNPVDAIVTDPPYGLSFIWSLNTFLNTFLYSVMGRLNILFNILNLTPPDNLSAFAV